MGHTSKELRGKFRCIRVAAGSDTTSWDTTLAATYSGLIFDISPDGQITALCDTIAEVVGRVRGPAATRYQVGVPHLTLAYAAGDADSDEIQRKLRRVRPSHAPMSISAVYLVDVVCDPAAKTITWTPPGTDQQVPLGSRPHPLKARDGVRACPTGG